MTKMQLAKEFNAIQGKARQSNVDVAAADANVAAELRATVTTATAVAAASTWPGQWAQDVVVSRSMP